jgi:lysophospholipase L1-like esterase
MTEKRGLVAVVCGVVLLAIAAGAEQPARRTSSGVGFVATWTGSSHGPYPSGNAAAQPELKFAFPDAAGGANDQTFRLIVKPDLWGPTFRIRFTNVFGTKSVTFDDIHLGVQAGGGNVVPGTNQRVTFGGKQTAVIPAGASLFSDPVGGAWPSTTSAGGRKLAISFHVVGTSGPMTWHAKALQTSYLTPPSAGAHGRDESDAAFPFTTTSWYFVDAVEVAAPPGTRVICAFGDSITDGTGSTLNGDDRWPDVLSRRAHAVYGDRISVVNAGIGGNRVLTPETYPAATPFAGGPSALQRLDRDLLQLSGLSTVIFFEGINDISAGSSAEAITAGIRAVVSRIRAKGGITIIGATITSALGANGRSGTPEANERRQAVNTFIRSSGIFDAVADFDAATLDPRTGGLREEFQPNSTVGGAGDRLHPNRAGYQAMAGAIDLALFRR